MRPKTGVINDPQEVRPPKPESTKTAKILLVEDEPLLMKLYTRVLSEIAETKVITAREEQEALRLIREELPHLVLLDLMIPTSVAHHAEYSFHEPVGFEVLRKIKQDPKTRNVRVVILSNLDADEHKQRAHELGAEDYVVKAMIKPQELMERIEQYLGRR